MIPFCGGKLRFLCIIAQPLCGVNRFNIIIFLQTILFNAKTIFLGSYSRKALEDRDKIARIGESALRADLGDAFVGAYEELFRLLYPMRAKKLGEGM